MRSISLRLHVCPSVPDALCNSCERRVSRRVAQLVYADSSKPTRVITSSRGSEAIALSQHLKISSAECIAELNSILSTGNYADSLHNSHVSAIVAAMPGTLRNQLIGQTERLAVQRMLKQLNLLASMYLHRFQPVEIVNLLEGWAELRQLDSRLHSDDPILASLLTDLLCESLSSLTPSQLATAAWSIGHLHVPLQRPALAALLAALQQQLSCLTPDDHIRVAHGLIQVGCPLPRAWSFDWQLRTAELPTMSASQAATMLGIAAQLPVFEHGDAPEWIDEMLAKTRGGLVGLPLSVLADTLTAVAKLSHPGSVAPGWINEFLAAASAALFPDAVVGRPPGNLPAAMQVPTAPAATPRELAALAAALGTLGLQPREEWMTAFLRVVGYKLPSFESDELAAIVWGLAMLDCRPDEDFLQQIVAEAECRVADFDLSQASKITWALGMMSYP